MVKNAKLFAIFLQKCSKFTSYDLENELEVSYGGVVLSKIFYFTAS